MKTLIVCMGMLALLVIQGGCGGSIRQLTDEGKSDAPELIAIRPLSGVSGQEVNFEVLLSDLSGSLGSDYQAHPERLQDLQFVWNFGGGVDPNSVITSSQSLPENVFLRDGIRSPYNGVLTVIGNRSAEDRLTYNFTFTVAPLTIKTVGPTSGVEDTKATFSAVIGSGNVSQYLWDFGGACDPNGSNEASPSVTFNTVAVETTFQARLIVSNPYEVTEFPFTITVLAAAE